MIYARFTGMCSETGDVTLSGIFWAAQRGILLYIHRSGQVLPCTRTPLTLMRGGVLLDTLTAPVVTLDDKERFTVLVMKEGHVDAATTYQVDGQTIVERKRLGDAIEIQCLLSSRGDPSNSSL